MNAPVSNVTALQTRITKNSTAMQKLTEELKAVGYRLIAGDAKAKKAYKAIQRRENKLMAEFDAINKEIRRMQHGPST